MTHPASEAPTARLSNRRRGPRDGLLAALAVALSAAIVAHPLVPGLGTAVAVVLPWLWLPALLLAAFAVRARGLRRLVPVVPLLVWVLVVGTTLIPLGTGLTAQPSGRAVTVASLNVHAGNPTVGASARALADAGAEVIVLVELDGAGRTAAAKALAARYPHSYQVGTLGVWSRYPLDQARPLDVDQGWKRAFAIQVRTPSGPLQLYAVHAASLRVGQHATRDRMLAALADDIAENGGARVLAVGDFNAPATDPAMSGIRAQLSEPHQDTASFGFTWPATMPVVRIDHVFQRGLTVTGNTVLTAGDSDHRAVLTRVVPAGPS